MADEILSIDDCNVVVKNYLNSEQFQIMNFEVKQFFDEVNGFLGEHLLLLIEVKLQGRYDKLRFFMKRFPFGHSMQSDFLKSMNGWQREIYFFEIFIENLKNTLPGYTIDFVPQYLLGKPDDIIVFEDLTLKNYYLPKGPSFSLLDDDHICLVMEALAKLHAGTLAYEEYMSRDQGKNFRLFTGEENFAKEPLIRKEEGFLGYDFFKAAMKGLRALINKVFKGDALSLAEVQLKFNNLIEKSLELMFPQSQFRNVWAHGDLWAKNVMYKYEEESTKPIHALLVDFQLQRYHVPAHDVLLFIFLTTNQAVRKRQFHFYLKYYHDCLTKELQKVNVDVNEVGMSREDFLRSVNFIMPEIKVQSALQRLQQCGNKEFYTKLLNDKEQFKLFIFGDKTPFVLELFETDANFRSLVSESIQELIETILCPEIFREDSYRILEEQFQTNKYELEDYKAVKSNYGDYVFELQMNVLEDGHKCILKYLVKSVPLDFARVIKKL